MKLTFCGGAGSVTGANYLVESGQTKILIDCGLSQGSDFAERQNFEKFPYDPREIDAVFVTHAHVDHTGKLPKLMKDGFKGKIFSTPPTRDFAEFLLIDSEHLINSEAERDNLPPLYSVEDIENLMKLWEGIEYHSPAKVNDMTVELFDAGHILGSATIKIEAEGKTLVFSGDLGNYPAPIIHRTEPMPEADYCCLESTYGDRVHENVENRRNELEDVVEDTVRKGGTLLIPAFAMERTQELLYHLDQLFSEGRIPKIPVFVDSPLAIKITSVYKKYERFFNNETQNVVRSGDDILNFPGLHLTLTTEESKSINAIDPPKIIMAGSGMSQGGRILHHERLYLSDPKNTILFVGYQAKGSLGRRILEGEKSVRIFGENIQINARVVSLSSYSAHADQPRLLEWVSPQRNKLKKIFVIQGEGSASEVLSQKIRDELAVHTEIPKLGDSFVL